MISNYKVILEILSNLNTFMPSPVCAYELKACSQLDREFTKLEKEFEIAGRMQKRGLKKQIDTITQEMKESEEKVVQCIYDSINKDMKADLENITKNISSVAPSVANQLRNIAFPMIPEIETISNFLVKLRSIHDEMTLHLKNLCKEALTSNKAKLTAYKKIISLDQSSTEQSHNLTDDTFSDMKIEGLLEALSALKKEKELINQQLASSADHVQENLLQTAHDLTYVIQECVKKKIITDLADYNEIKELVITIQKTSKMDELNNLWNELQQYIVKYRSFFKSEITRVRTEGQNIVVHVRNMFPILSDKWMPVPPAIVTSDASLTALNTFSNQMEDWTNQLLTGIKKIASVDELTRISQGTLQEGITIPNTILINSREIAKLVEESTNLDVAFKKLQDFHVIYTRYLEYIRDGIRSNLSFDVTDSSSISGGMISIKPPSVNLKSTSPSELLSYLRNVNSWAKSLINTLQETRHAINDTIATVNQLEKKGISIPSTLQVELTSLYEKIQSETEISGLMNLRQAYDHLYKEFVTLTAANIKDFVKDVSIIQLLEQEDIPKPPFVEDAGELDLSELLARIDKVEKWKEQVISYLKKIVESFNFPMIPGEVPVDLRREKNALISQMNNVAATRNFINTLRSYSDFINNLVSSKNTMISEVAKQVELADEIDQSSLKHFKEVIGRHKTFQVPTDLEKLDYAELMELWHKFNTFNKKKNELVQLKCREILFNWQKQYKSLPAHFLNVYNPLLIIFDQALIDMNQPLSVDQTFTRFEFFIENGTRKALESLEKLKALFYNQTTVSLPRITEIIGELSPEIYKIRDFLESSISPKGQTLETIHRMTIETIHDFDYVLIARLVELLSFSSSNLLSKITELRNRGINIQNLIGEQIEVFSQLLQSDSSDIMSIKMITQSFIELDKILKNEKLQKALFEIVDNSNTTAGRILDLIQALGWKNASQVLMPHIVTIKQARSRIQFWSFDIIAQATIDVKKTSKEMIEAIKKLELENYESYLTDLASDPKIAYYNSIQSVFEFRFEQCSENIFPLKDLYDNRDKLQSIEDLVKIYDLLTSIVKLQTQWKQEWLPLLNKFHRLLFLFICDYQPTTVREEKITYLANAKREIEETYDYQPLVYYLSTAVGYFIENN